MNIVRKPLAESTRKILKEIENRLLKGKPKLSIDFDNPPILISNYDLAEIEKNGHKTFVEEEKNRLIGLLASHLNWFVNELPLCSLAFPLCTLCDAARMILRKEDRFKSIYKSESIIARVATYLVQLAVRDKDFIKKYKQTIKQ